MITPNVGIKCANDVQIKKKLYIFALRGAYQHGANEWLSCVNHSSEVQLTHAMRFIRKCIIMR